MNVFGIIFYQFVKDNTLVFCTREIKSVRMIRDEISEKISLCILTQKAQKY